MSGVASSPSKSGIVPIADLHCHLLPEWDDGPKNLDESLAMARRAAEAGLQYIVVTPHVGREFKGVAHPAANIPPAVAKLQQTIDEAGIAIKLINGAEVALGLVDLMGGGYDPDMTFGSARRFVLVESPFPSWPDYMARSLEFFNARNITPIIAHPERYAEVQKDPRVLERAMMSGCLLQITAASVLGEQGKETQACAEKLLRLGWVACVASDAHRARHFLPSQAVEAVVKIVGEEAARRIFEEFPLRIVKGQPLSFKSVLMESEAEKPKGTFLQRMLGLRR